MHTKPKTNSEPPQQLEVHKTINQQHHYHRLITDGSLNHGGGGGGGLKRCLLAPNISVLPLDFVVNKTQTLFSSHNDCHKTSGRQLKYSNQLSLSHQNGCKTRTQSVE